ncbi:MAG: alanine racemase C-terminal domain-containing protein [Methylococcales bacterium]
MSRIIDIRQLRPGDPVGYGRTYIVGSEPIPVGILPIGYNDGLPWSLGNRGIVVIGGVECPIIGRVSMDSITVNLQAVLEPTIGMEALIYGQKDGFELRPERQAALAGTLPYELLVRLGRRVQRVFI